MKIFIYYKTDRGYYETAYAHWKKQGGDFNEHLLNTQNTLYCWRREFQKQGHQLEIDIRSSYVLPQTARRHLPLPLSNLLRNGLWVTRLDPGLLQLDLLRKIERFQPDWVFFPLGSSVWGWTLRQLKQKGFKLAQWCGLPAQTMLPRDRANLAYFDLIFQNSNFTAGLRAAGATGQIEYVPCGVDEQRYRPLSLAAAERAPYTADICFIGSLLNAFHSSRRQAVEYAIEHGIDIKVWGGRREHYRHSPILKVWQGEVWGEEEVKVLCSAKLGLNFHMDHAPGEIDHGLNLRAFQLPACEVFQLLQRVPSVAEFFEEGREIICFESKEEMLDKIRYYLAHDTERQTIARAGRDRTLREHTWAHRVALMSQFFQTQP